MSVWNTGHNVKPGQSKVMFDLSGHKVTGFVMPIGSGAVGKTSLALTLEKHTLPMDWAAFLNSVPKSQNLEFRYVLDKDSCE